MHNSKESRLSQTYRKLLPYGLLLAGAVAIVFLINILGPVVNAKTPVNPYQVMYS